MSNSTLGPISPESSFMSSERRFFLACAKYIRKTASNYVLMVKRGPQEVVATENCALCDSAFFFSVFYCSKLNDCKKT